MTLKVLFNELNMPLSEEKKHLKKNELKHFAHKKELRLCLVDEIHAGMEWGNFIPIFGRAI